MGSSEEIYARIVDLCKDRKASIRSVELALGFGNGSIKRMRDSKISTDRIQAIADYFDVPLAYLLEGEMPEYYTNTETAEIAQEIFESKEMRALFSAARDASKEDLLTTYQMLLALKKKENRRDD